MKNEIILYRPNEVAEHIEVRVENETVWLNQAQMAVLFKQSKQNISLHKNNCFKEGELIPDSVVKDSLTTAIDGKLYKTKFYNLDVIISVGYRVKSKQGTQFRIWATSVLHDYLLKGYAINQRVDRIENNIENLTKKVSELSLQLKSNEIPTQGVFFNGQIFDTYDLMSKIIRSAKNEIILIDNYIDETVLTHLSKRAENVEAIIYTKSISRVLQLDLERHNSQYPPIQIKELRDSHDRFLIIDRKELYHIGASLKDLGKKWFAFSKLNGFLPEVLGMLN